MFLYMIMFIMQKIINISERSKKNTYYFYHDIIIITTFEPDLNHTKTLVFTILDILQLKKLMIMKIFTV